MLLPLLPFPCLYPVSRPPPPPHPSLSPQSHIISKPKGFSPSSFPPALASPADHTPVLELPWPGMEELILLPGTIASEVKSYSSY